MRTRATRWGRSSRGRRSTRAPEIAELSAFCAAVDLGTIGRAAIALQVSQPAISKRLRILEAAAGVELLDRSTSGVVPTAVGRRLYPEARRLLDQVETIEALLESDPTVKAPIQLATSHTIAEFFLPPELVAYQGEGGRRPPVELTIANSGAVRQMVIEGRAAMGITAVAVDEQAGEIEQLSLLKDEVVIAVPESHAWYRRAEIPLSLFLGTQVVMRDPDAHDRRTVEQALSQRGLSAAEPLAEVGSTAVAKREAMRRSAPVLLSALALNEPQDALYQRPIEGLRFERRFAVISRSFSALSGQDRHFIDFLRRRVS
jgi:DNA-binding transcriptional LysR family regulator